MSYTGRCYCGDLQYEFTGPIHSQILCHWRECRYLSGGAANTSVVISEDSFKWTKGTPSIFERSDLDAPRTRYFLWKVWNSYLRQKSAASRYVGVENW